jgi:hypothetical protein
MDLDACASRDEDRRLLFYTPNNEVVANADDLHFQPGTRDQLPPDPRRRKTLAIPQSLTRPVTRGCERGLNPSFPQPYLIDEERPAPYPRLLICKSVLGGRVRRHDAQSGEQLHYCNNATGSIDIGTVRRGGWSVSRP